MTASALSLQAGRGSQGMGKITPFVESPSQRSHRQIVECGESAFWNWDRSGSGRGGREGFRSGWRRRRRAGEGEGRRGRMGWRSCREVAQ